jgi:erythromycin esterase
MDNFVERARASLARLTTVKPGRPWDDLLPLERMVGNATIVALSEGVHGAAEPLEFRNRVFQYLVEHCGFTAIAIESGIVESRVVHDFVRGASGELDGVVSEGITWGMDRLPQNRALVRWLKEYNADSSRRKVNFYGFDIAGSPASAQPRSGPDIALRAVLDFLDGVDVSASETFRLRLQPAMRSMQFSLRRTADTPGYARLSWAERDALTAAIADLIGTLERKQSEYVAASSAHDYKWAYRAAIAGRQVDTWLRQVPIGWAATDPRNAAQEALPRFLSAASDLRDHAQADNLEWIVHEEGLAGKVLVFASRYHLSGARLKASWSPDTREWEQDVAGCHLRRRFGERLVTIGNLIGRGRIGCDEHEEILLAAPADSIDGLARQVGTPLFLWDLRDAPAATRQWLSEERRLVAGTQTLKLPVARAFDILFYIDEVTPACAAAASVLEV